MAVLPVRLPLPELCMRQQRVSLLTSTCRRSPACVPQLRPHSEHALVAGPALLWADSTSHDAYEAIMASGWAYRPTS